MRGMESHETSVLVRKRRNRDHHNSRNGCLQCKARKVKVIVSSLVHPNVVTAHPLHSVTKKNLSAEAALGEPPRVPMSIMLA